MAEYFLLPNYLTPDPNDCAARVRSLGIVDEATLIGDMLKRGTTLNRPDLEGTLHMLYDAILDRLAEGYTVSMAWAEIGLTIRGVFDSPQDTFDPARHVLDASVAASSKMRADLRRRVSVQKSTVLEKRPQPVALQDVTTGETNGPLTPGGMAELRGAFLKFDPADPQQGLFFTDAEGNETRVDMVGINKPSQQMFLIPATLTGGTYTLEVRAVIGKSELRVGRLHNPLTVPPGGPSLG